MIGYGGSRFVLLSIFASLVLDNSRYFLQNLTILGIITIIIVVTITIILIIVIIIIVIIIRIIVIIIYLYNNPIYSHILIGSCL